MVKIEFVKWDTQRLEQAPVVDFLARARRQQVRQREVPLRERRFRIDCSHEAGIGRIDEAGLAGVGRNHKDAYADFFELILERPPLLNRPRPVGPASRSPTRAGVRVRPSLDAEMGGVSH